MENEMIKKAKEKVLNSPVVKYVSEEKINLAFEKIYICNSREELYEKYYEINNKKYDGFLKGFNNNEVSYIINDGSIHELIHEIFHTLSSEFKDGHRIVNGIQGEMNKGNFGSFVNEGLTDFLASKLSGEKDLAYKEQRILFEEIEEGISNFFESEDILFDIYLNKDTERLKYFIDSCVKEGTFDEIYNQYEFLNKEKRLQMAEKINKGAQKLIKKREFYKKHPFLAKIANRIGKNNNTNIPTLKSANIINYKNEDLSSKLKEDIAPIEDVQITEKEDKIEEKQINEETIEV